MRVVDVNRSSSQSSSKKTYMRLGLLLALALGLPPLHASPNDALATKYACVACHQATQAAVGPAWNDIRSKYAGKVSAAELASRVKAGSSGKWGAVPMPPQTAVPDSDLQALTSWILEGTR